MLRRVNTLDPSDVVTTRSSVALLALQGWKGWSWAEHGANASARGCPVMKPPDPSECLSTSFTIFLGNSWVGNATDPADPMRVVANGQLTLVDMQSMIDPDLVNFSDECRMMMKMPPGSSEYACPR